MSTGDKQRRESLILRVVWMLVFFVVWQLAELLLLGIVIAQVIIRLIRGAHNEGLAGFGDSLSRYLAQIGRFATFHSEEKPWPFADWPRARASDTAVTPEPASVDDPLKAAP